ncbi:hypothetical protein HYX58_00155 [Candidatus Dependentiae bacterium]|nr:hypothetical protein [Candidatus Dependentiae bacterium]
MKKNHFLFVLLFCLFSSRLLYSTDLLINQPGKYKLGDSIISVPNITGDTIITISSSNVLFDFGGYTLSQGNSVGNCTGIIINPNLSDIIIQNGCLQNITGTGILINQGCSKIKINNIAFKSIGFEGLALKLLKVSALKGLR